MPRQFKRTKYWRIGIFVCLISVCLLTVSTQIAGGQVAGPQDAFQIELEYAPLTRRSAPHSDFTLPSIDGDESIQLSDYRGKKVLLLHFASW